MRSMFSRAMSTILHVLFDQTQGSTSLVFPIPDLSDQNLHARPPPLPNLMMAKTRECLVHLISPMSGLDSLMSNGKCFMPISAFYPDDI